MAKLRRAEFEARLEIMPLIDVIFLLLTFFIFSFTVMVRANWMPVELTPVGGQAMAGASAMRVLAIDAAGRVLFDRTPVTESQLDDKLAELARQDQDAPMLYLAVQQEGEVDRAPLLLNLLERVQRAGVTRFTIVGQPAPQQRRTDSP